MRVNSGWFGALSTLECSLCGQCGWWVRAEVIGQPDLNGQRHLGSLAALQKPARWPRLIRTHARTLPLRACSHRECSGTRRGNQQAIAQKVGLARAQPEGLGVTRGAAR